MTIVLLRGGERCGVPSPAAVAPAAAGATAAALFRPTSCAPKTLKSSETSERFESPGKPWKRTRAAALRGSTSTGGCDGGFHPLRRGGSAGLQTRCAPSDSAALAERGKAPESSQSHRVPFRTLRSMPAGEWCGAKHRRRATSRDRSKTGSLESKPNRASPAGQPGGANRDVERRRSVD